MIQRSSLINLACIQNEAYLPHFEYMIMTWQIFALIKLVYLDFLLQAM